MAHSSGGPPCARRSCHTVTRRSGSAYGSGRSNAAWTTLNTAVFSTDAKGQRAEQHEGEPGAAEHQADGESEIGHDVTRGKRRATKTGTAARKSGVNDRFCRAPMSAAGILRASNGRHQVLKMQPECKTPDATGKIPQVPHLPERAAIRIWSAAFTTATARTPAAAAWVRRHPVAAERRPPCTILQRDRGSESRRRTGFDAAVHPEMPDRASRRRSPPCPRRAARRVAPAVRHSDLQVPGS